MKEQYKNIISGENLHVSVDQRFRIACFGGGVRLGGMFGGAPGGGLSRIILRV
jgi:hypothetical protein